MPRGGKRAGAGRKRGTKIKLTRELGRTLTELCKTQTHDMVDVLAGIAKGSSYTAGARVTAATAIIEHGWGKPKQQIDAKVNIGIAARLEAALKRRSLKGGEDDDGQSGASGDPAR